MNYLKSSLKLTEDFEGCRLAAYRDGNGVLTIGYGHTSNVNEGDTCTQEQAEVWLAFDVAWAATTVNKLVKVVLNQEEFDSLVDFVFNCGSGNFASSTLLKDLNARNFADVAEQFERWDKCDGTVCAGLLRRRAAEAAEFNS